MQIVIDIPDYTWTSIQRGEYCGIINNEMYKNVRNGTPLPKGHGRLIDVDELKKHKYHDNDRFENAVSVAQIDWADTIIEADKEVTV